MTADETGYQLLWQRFEGGQLLATPDGRFIYAVFTNRPSNGSALLGIDERYAVPAR